MGYYYSFDGTGITPVDNILWAVESAGKRYHHTENWNEKDEGETSCVDDIERAAKNSAMVFKALQDRITALVKETEALRNLCGDAAEVLSKDASWSCSDVEDAIIKLQEACDNGIEGGK